MCSASEKNLGLKPVFFPGGICRRLRRGAAIRFRQKPKLALSINGEIASKMVKPRRPEDPAKFTRPHDSRAHTAERHTTKKGKKEKGEVFTTAKPVRLAVYILCRLGPCRLRGTSGCGRCCRRTARGVGHHARCPGARGRPPRCAWPRRAGRRRRWQGWPPPAGSRARRPGKIVVLELDDGTRDKCHLLKESGAYRNSPPCRSTWHST